MVLIYSILQKRKKWCFLYFEKRNIIYYKSNNNISIPLFFEDNGDIMEIERHVQ